MSEIQELVRDLRFVGADCWKDSDKKAGAGENKQADLWFKIGADIRRVGHDIADAYHRKRPTRHPALSTDYEAAIRGLAARCQKQADRLQKTADWETEEEWANLGDQLERLADRFRKILGG